MEKNTLRPQFPEIIAFIILTLFSLLQYFGVYWEESAFFYMAVAFGILFIRKTVFLLSELTDHKTKGITSRQRKIFASLIVFSSYLLFSGYVRYAIQDSSPKQTVAIMWLFISIGFIVLLFSLFFKIHKHKLESIFDIILPQKNNKKERRIFTVMLLSVYMIFFYQIAQISVDINERANRNAQEVLQIMEKYGENRTY